MNTFIFFLKRTQPHTISFLWLLCATTAKSNSLSRPYGLQSSNIYRNSLQKSLALYRKKFADPWFTTSSYVIDKLLKDKIQKCLPIYTDLNNPLFSFQALFFYPFVCTTICHNLAYSYILLVSVNKHRLPCI